MKVSPSFPQAVWTTWHAGNLLWKRPRLWAVPKRHRPISDASVGKTNLPSAVKCPDTGRVYFICWQFELLAECFGRRSFWSFRLPAQDRHEAAGRAHRVAAEAQHAAHPDLLERVLQLRPVYVLPGTHHPGLEVSDPVYVGSDHVGLLLPAVLPVGGQLPGRSLQENVRQKNKKTVFRFPFKMGFRTPFTLCHSICSATCGTGRTSTE